MYSIVVKYNFLIFMLVKIFKFCKQSEIVEIKKGESWLLLVTD